MNIKNKLTLLSASLLTLPARISAEGSYDGSKFLNGIVDTEADAANTYDGINSTLTDVLNFVRIAGIVVCVIMLVWCAIQLAASAGNNQKRQVAMEGIKNVLIAVAIIGGATLVASLAYGILK